MENKGEVIIYESNTGESRLEVKLQNETLWLSLNQLTQLFERDKSVISRHIKNVFGEGELDKNSVVAFFATTASDNKTYRVEHYNLDAIISIGYRVNSKRGTQFRIWATQTLKDHLVKGYTVNEKRLREQREKFEERHQTVEVLKTAPGSKNLSGSEAQGLPEIISTYTRSFVLLNQFDSETLPDETSDEALTHAINYEEARAAIEGLKKSSLPRARPPTFLAGDGKTPSAAS